MKAVISHQQISYYADLNSPIDISIPMSEDSIVAWGMPNLSISPVENQGWIGDVDRGGSVNFNNILFNPHAHGTHTECVGHISSNKESLNKELKTFFFIARLISVCPKVKNNDTIVTEHILSKLIKREDGIDALIVRTLPNKEDKKAANYSNTNPTYFSKKAIQYIIDIGIKHLLIDLPSVDKEDDEGELISHKTFWNYPVNDRSGYTITELIYVPSHVQDGKFLLNLQFAPFENDASPSRPIIFKLNTQ